MTDNLSINNQPVKDVTVKRVKRGDEITEYEKAKADPASDLFFKDKKGDTYHVTGKGLSVKGVAPGAAITFNDQPAMVTGVDPGQAEPPAAIKRLLDAAEEAGKQAKINLMLGGGHASGGALQTHKARFDQHLHDAEAAHRMGYDEQADNCLKLALDEARAALKDAGHGHKDSEALARQSAELALQVAKTARGMGLFTTGYHALKAAQSPYALTTVGAAQLSDRDLFLNILREAREQKQYDMASAMIEAGIEACPDRTHLLQLATEAGLLDKASLLPDDRDVNSAEDALGKATDLATTSAEAMEVARKGQELRNNSRTAKGWLIDKTRGAVRQAIIKAATWQEALGLMGEIGRLGKEFHSYQLDAVERARQLAGKDNEALKQINKAALHL